MIKKLAARGVPSEKLVLLTNGVDTTYYRPAPPDAELARRLGIDGKKVFLYAGTHGMAQGLDVILEAARRTWKENVLYVLAGEGADKESLMWSARVNSLANVCFIPNQPKSTMPALLNLAYATVIPLRRLDLFRSALPSKLFESMACAKPIVAALWGEAADLVREANCGVVVEPEDPDALCEAVESLAADPERARALGENGRRYVTAHYDRTTIASRFIELLAATSGRGPG
jgi:glycosyltransferase involved in cell wall biosynthesis